MTVEEAFGRLASRVARGAGSPAAFTMAVLVIVGWAVVGPLVGFSEIWQLAINTGTTIVTFLMVFVIQNSQNRDTGALQMKLDELIRATKGASNALIDLENADAADIKALHERYCAIAEKARTLGFDFSSDAPTEERSPADGPRIPERAA
jgi:low affinity Fe/Cu permease